MRVNNWVCEGAGIGSRARREVRDGARGFGEERIGSTDHVE